MDISLAPETVFTLAGYHITNSMLAAPLVSLFLIICALIFRRRLLRLPGQLQAGLELLYSVLYDNAVAIIGKEEIVKELFPYLITLFLYIIFSSWIGLIPGVSTFGLREVIDGKQTIVPLLRAPVTDLNSGLALALISVFYTQYLGIKYAGFKNYLHKFFNFKSPMNFIAGLLELVSEFTRLISFSFRLFGNIFAGEVLLVVILFLTINLMPAVVPLPLPFFMLETLEALIQAYVFYFLTVIFVALAVTSHGEPEAERLGETAEMIDPGSEKEVEQQILSTN